MPDPTKGSPLAGIEQSQRNAAVALFDAAKTYRHLSGPEDEAAWGAEMLALQSLASADYLAGLGKVLEEWREAQDELRDSDEENPNAVGLAIARRDAAEIALYRLLTPDSPRQAGEEITDG